ncbi:hypothetical protein TanjilG_09858 [Lupinus angustifolius]|uniref:non-specific serine/threonine protein kinase n=1 Tax=Lupinus angustifolius TaxID=3871 RepID=A0A4P1QWK2_LUPAN|nr:hypothetical protein TanjilG_09858 [Lupinus angustifolius]
MVMAFWFGLLLLRFLLCLNAISVDSDDGATLLELKKSLRDVDNVLYDWTDPPSSDYCMWRGVTCDDVTFNVVALNLSGLNLEGEISPAIGSLNSLVSIDLKENRLSGLIPDEIGDCSSLKSLDLSLNEIHGDIPFSISKMNQLENLILRNNKLIGPIPSTLSQIPNLKILDLAQNNLSGEIPELIYWNEVLQYIDLGDNHLVGSLSPNMCRLTGLWYFNVHNNSLTGSIPENIGNCTTLQILDLSFNQLTGEIPYNIGFLQVATLALQGNKLSGRIPPVIGLMQALDILDLRNNMLSGPIPPVLGNLIYAKILYLNGNRLTGSIPPELGNLTNVHYLELSDNHLSGHIPPELGKLTDLLILNVANNNLEGPIPDNISSCRNLNSLNVNGNKLNGTIPLAFHTLESMTYLNLSSNNLQGCIPIELSLIGNLDTLDISNNNISGSIPSSLGNLEHLLKLSLSRNHLTGSIPAEFRNLRSVMRMRLENNKLSGGVRPLANCPSLSLLNVSYNNLTGVIPTSNNFTRFPPDSFIGNPGLCGYWLGSSCHGSRTAERELDKGFRADVQNELTNVIDHTVTLSKAAILGIAIGVLMVLLMILLAACQLQNSAPFPDGSLDKSVNYSPPKLVILDMNMALHVYEDIMRITENLSEKYIIGHGASSKVYKCVLMNCKPVAVKRIYSQYPQYLKEFETELATIGSIKHRNLVALQGYSLSPFGNLLFYDYMENGSLWDLLHGPNKKKKLVWDIRLKIALGAAQGLAYLHHDCTPHIIHRDVKSSNILLDKDMESHITDFGIAKSLNPTNSHTSTHIMGTIGYIDPEYARTSRLTEKSDVYSYGIVLLELLTGRKAVDNESNLHHLILSKTANNAVMEIIDPDITATCKDIGTVRKVFQLALLCTKTQPNDRPAMHEVARILETLVSSSTTLSKQPAPIQALNETQSSDKSAMLH